MKKLDIKLTVPDFPLLDDQAGALLNRSTRFQSIPQSIRAKFWNDAAVPNGVKFALNTQNAAIFLAVDWTGTIFGKKWEDCIGGLCDLNQDMVSIYHCPVTMDLLQPKSDKQVSIASHLKHEEVMNKIWAVLRYLATLAIGSALGVAAQQLYEVLK